MPTAYLTNWRLTYFAGYARLSGQVKGSRRFPDGDVITTSVLKSIDFERKVAVTRNTIYVLQTPAV